MNDSLPLTETVNPRTHGLDELETPALVHLLLLEQRHAVDVVVAQSEAIATAVDVIAARIRTGGRLHYVGAGTSGRMGFLDASEAPPTFGILPALVCAHIAGGPAALTRAVEGAEDNGDAGAHEMRDHIQASDVVVGLSASGTAPYVIAAMLTARGVGAWTISITNSPDSTLAKVTDQSIVLETGAEPLTGSTRLKAGTAQKLVLNAISTAAMVRLGKVHDNLMGDVGVTNNKLRGRALRLVMELAEVDELRAAELLAQADGRVKVAVVMAKRSLDAGGARARLDAAQDSLRNSL